MTTTSLTHIPQDSGVPASARDFSVERRVVIITGAAQGIGRELARQFAAAGAFAVVADLDIDKASAVVKEIQDAGGVGLAIKVNVADELSVAAMVDTVIEEVGPDRCADQQRIDLRQHREGPVRRDPRGAVGTRAESQCHRELPVRSRGGCSYAHGGIRPHHQHLLRCSDPGHRQLPALRHLQVGVDRHDQLVGARAGRLRNHRQLRAPGQRRHGSRARRQPHRRGS